MHKLNISYLLTSLIGQGGTSRTRKYLFYNLHTLTQKSIELFHKIPVPCNLLEQLKSTNGQDIKLIYNDIIVSLGHNSMDYIRVIFRSK